MRARWGSRRKPLLTPSDSQPRQGGAHTWHWWDAMSIAFFWWLTILRIHDASHLGPFLFAGWLGIVAILTSWSIALSKDGSLGELTRSCIRSWRGRVVAWLLFFGLAAGIAYAVYWWAFLQP